MLRRRRRTPVARDVVKDGAHLMQHTVALRQMTTFLERYPCALVLSISALHLLMHALLHLALQDACSRRLVIVGNL
jgi:hypothetical protein